LPAVKAVGAKVSMYQYDRPSWTGKVYPTECFFPTWKTPEDHITVARSSSAYRKACSRQAGDRQVDLLHQRCVDHGPPRHPGGRLRPGQGAQAHAPNEKTWKEHLVKCAAMYAAVPVTYLQLLARQPAAQAA
jgi:acetylornithine deacetylase/succinyl-diaminopimelate desuccinylase-like protein